jgi:hypothetical protein
MTRPFLRPQRGPWPGEFCKELREATDGKCFYRRGQQLRLWQRAFVIRRKLLQLSQDPRSFELLEKFLSIAVLGVATGFMLGHHQLHWGGAAAFKGSG